MASALAKELKDDDRERLRLALVTGLQEEMANARSQLRYWERRVDALEEAPPDMPAREVQAGMTELTHRIRRNESFLKRAEAALALEQDRWAFEDRLRLAGVAGLGITPVGSPIS